MVSAGYDDSLFVWNLDGLISQVPKIEGRQGSRLFNPRLSSVNPKEDKIVYGNKGGDIQVVNITTQDGKVCLR